MLKNVYNQNSINSIEYNVLKDEDLSVFNSLIEANQTLAKEKQLNFYVFYANHLVKDIIDGECCSIDQINSKTKGSYAGCLTYCDYFKEIHGESYKIGGSIEPSRQISLKSFPNAVKLNKLERIHDLENRNCWDSHIKMYVAKHESDKIIRNLGYLKFFMIMWPNTYDLCNLANVDFGAGVNKYFGRNENFKCNHEEVLNNLKIITMVIKNSTNVEVLENSHRGDLERIMNVICESGNEAIAKYFIENAMVRLKNNYNDNVIKFISKFGWVKVKDELWQMIKRNDLKENCRIFNVSII
jgi:hypothetical protein